MLMPTQAHATADFTSTASGTALFNHAATALAALNAEVPDHERITDDEQGILAAFALSLRADCTRRRVAAVAADAFGRVIGTGRNGAPPGRPGCLSAGACPRGQMSKTDVLPGSSYSHGAGSCIALHAEVNCIMNASSPERRRGGTIYITDVPCDDCCKNLAGSGFARAVWPERLGDGTWKVVSFDLNGPIGGHYS